MRDQLNNKVQCGDFVAFAIINDGKAEIATGTIEATNGVSITINSDFGHYQVADGECVLISIKGDLK